MKKRSLIKMFLLEIVTLGIYRIYFLIKTRKEIMTLNPSVKIKSSVLLIVPCVLVTLAIISAVVAGTISGLDQANCENNNRNDNSPSVNQSLVNPLPENCVADKSNTASAIVFLMLYPVFIIAGIMIIIWEWSYSHGVENITGEKLSFAVALIVLILVPMFAILIIQDYFNKLGSVVPVSGASSAGAMAMNVTASIPSAPIESASPENQDVSGPNNSVPQA